jgi:hypothetical protein
MEECLKELTEGKGDIWFVAMHESEIVGLIIVEPYSSTKYVFFLSIFFREGGEEERRREGEGEEREKSLVPSSSCSLSFAIYFHSLSLPPSISSSPTIVPLLAPYIKSFFIF